MMAQEIPPELEADLALTRTSIPDANQDGSVPLVTIRGGWALLLLGGVLAALVFNALYSRPVSPAESVALSRGLGLQYVVRFSQEERRRSSRVEPEVVVERMASLREVSFLETDAKGWGSGRVVRVKIEVSGGLPPDGRAVRYFQLHCLTGCDVIAEISRLEYVLGLWFADPGVGSFP